MRNKSNKSDQWAEPKPPDYIKIGLLNVVAGTKRCENFTTVIADGFRIQNERPQQSSLSLSFRAAEPDSALEHGADEKRRMRSSIRTRSSSSAVVLGNPPPFGNGRARRPPESWEEATRTCC